MLGLYPLSVSYIFPTNLTIRVASDPVFQRTLFVGGNMTQICCFSCSLSLTSFNIPSQPCCIAGPAGLKCTEASCLSLLQIHHITAKCHPILGQLKKIVLSEREPVIFTLQLLGMQMAKLNQSAGANRAECCPQ